LRIRDPAVRSWLADSPRVHVHFTPTQASGMNLVEVWFGIIERQAIHCGTFGSVRDLNAKIRAFIAGWNDRCHPFVWTKTADQNLKKANRQQSSETSPRSPRLLCCRRVPGTSHWRRACQRTRVIPQACCGTG
jgi:hypothetical protein